MSSGNQISPYITVTANVPVTLLPGTRVTLAATAGTPGELKACTNGQIGIGVVEQGVGISASPQSILVLTNGPGTRAGIWSGTNIASGAVLYAGNQGTVQGAPDTGAGTMVGQTTEQMAISSGTAPIQFIYGTVV